MKYCGLNEMMFTINETLLQKSPVGRWKCSDTGQGEEDREQEKSLFIFNFNFYFY